VSSLRAELTVVATFGGKLVSLGWEMADREGYGGRGYGGYVLCLCTACSPRTSPCQAWSIHATTM